MKNAECLTASAQQMAAAMAAGDTSSRELVETHIQHVRKVNPQINAVVFDRFELAREEADAADRLRAQGGTLPPLLGVPCTIKENFELTGTPQASASGRQRPSAAGPSHAAAALDTSVVIWRMIRASGPRKARACARGVSTAAPSAPRVLWRSA